MTFWDWTNFTLALAIALTCYFATGAVYRLYFSPISHFPGPKLAASTFWYITAPQSISNFRTDLMYRYEFYYDVVLRGQYTFRLRRLHEKYGPIIRINPYELHISDSAYYGKLYSSSASGEKRDKWGWYTKQFGTPGAMFSTTPHDLHKARRAALNRFFSMASVRKLQPLIQERLQQLMERLRTCDEIIPLNVAFAAFTNGTSGQDLY